jgi:hypothetical protein
VTVAHQKIFKLILATLCLLDGLVVAGVIDELRSVCRDGVLPIDSNDDILAVVTKLVVVEERSLEVEVTSLSFADLLRFGTPSHSELPLAKETAIVIVVVCLDDPHLVKALAALADPDLVMPRRLHMHLNPAI